MPRVPKKKAASSSSSDSGPDDVTPAKKSKPEPSKTESSSSKGKSSGGGGGGDDDTTKTWILEKMRMVKVSEFRGRQMIDIREHYEVDGDIRPGKKGISLSTIQWKKLCSLMDEINKTLN